MSSEKDLRARAVAALYREYAESGVDVTDAMLPVYELAYRIEPERQARARQVIRQLARDDNVPLELIMDDSAVEFAIDDVDSLHDWATAYVGSRDPDLLPL